jgi:hypothetical protein
MDDFIHAPECEEKKAAECFSSAAFSLKDPLPQQAAGYLKHQGKKQTSENITRRDLMNGNQFPFDNNVEDATKQSNV